MEYGQVRKSVQELWRQKAFNPSQARDAIGRWTSSDEADRKMPTSLAEYEKPMSAQQSENYDTLRDNLNDTDLGNIINNSNQKVVNGVLKYLAEVAMGKNPKVPSAVQKWDAQQRKENPADPERLVTAEMKKAALDVRRVMKERGLKMTSKELQNHLYDILGSPESGDD